MRIRLKQIDTQQYYEVAVFAEKWQYDEVEAFAVSRQKAAGQWPHWFPELTMLQQYLCNLAGVEASKGLMT